MTPARLANSDAAELAEKSCAIVLDRDVYHCSRNLGMLRLLEWLPTLEDRLEIAGRRLAALLNAASH